MISRRTLLSALPLLPFAPLACSRGGDRSSMKLQLDWVPEPAYGGFYAAQVAGSFEAHGLAVEILGGGAGVPVVQMVASGTVDFGITGAAEVLNARARGADLIPLFAVYQRSPQGIMVHESRGVKTLGEALSGGTLALELGVPHALFLKKKYGFDRVKVVPYDGGVARFLADKDFAQQCFVTTEPVAARKRGGDPRVFLIADEGFDPYLGVVITRAAAWKERPELVKAFTRATRAGWRAYLDDPGPANAAMGRLNASMDAETFAAAAAADRPFIETDETKRRGLGWMSRERWEALGRQLVELGFLERVSVPEIPSVE